MTKKVIFQEGKKPGRTTTADPPDSPSSVGWTHAKRMVLATENEPFVLDSGATIAPLEVEYETYGVLNEKKDNAIFIPHALTGDAHIAGWDADASPEYRPWRLRYPGWWDAVVGPGKPFDTNRFFIIGMNVAGSCYGSTGPSSINPATGKPYGLSFPFITVGDWVRMEAKLMDKLGIEKLYAVCGGSLGGQQALEWALAFPKRLQKCIVLAASPVLSAQGLAFNAVARQTIMHDANFNDGNYYNSVHPDMGLAAARMLAHITYLSGKGMDVKFGRRRQRDFYETHTFDVEFAVESYLEHQGETFVERFDANSYLYMTRAQDYFDSAEKWGGGDLRKALKRIKAEMMVVSFSSDWLYPPEASEDFVRALLHDRIPVTYMQLETSYGHDAFLVEEQAVGKLLRAFLKDASSLRQVKR